MKNNASNNTFKLADFDQNGLVFKTVRELHDAVRDLKEISWGERNFAAIVTIAAKTFESPYTAEQRSYVVGSDAPFFGGRPLFDGEPQLVGDALTDDDPGVYLLENIEGKFGAKWEVEKCIIPSKGGYLLPVARLLPSARVSFAQAVAREVYRNMTISKASPEEAQAKAEKAAENVMNDAHPFWNIDVMKLEGTPFPEDADFEKRNPGTKKRRAKREAWLADHKSFKDFAPKPAAAPAKPKAKAEAKPDAPANGAGTRATAKPAAADPAKPAPAPEKPAKGKPAAPAKTPAQTPDAKHYKKLPTKKTPKPAPAKAKGKAKPMEAKIQAAINAKLGFDATKPATPARKGGTVNVVRVQAAKTAPKGKTAKKPAKK